MRHPALATPTIENIGRLPSLLLLCAAALADMPANITYKHNQMLKIPYLRQNRHFPQPFRAHFSRFVPFLSTTGFVFKSSELLCDVLLFSIVVQGFYIKIFNLKLVLKRFLARLVYKLIFLLYKSIFIIRLSVLNNIPIVYTYLGREFKKEDP